MKFEHFFYFDDDVFFLFEGDVVWLWLSCNGRPGQNMQRDVTVRQQGDGGGGGGGRT